MVTYKRLSFATPETRDQQIPEYFTLDIPYFLDFRAVVMFDVGIGEPQNELDQVPWFDPDFDIGEPCDCPDCAWRGDMPYLARQEGKPHLASCHAPYCADHETYHCISCP